MRSGLLGQCLIIQARLRKPVMKLPSTQPQLEGSTDESGSHCFGKFGQFSCRVLKVLQIMIEMKQKRRRYSCDEKDKNNLSWDPRGRQNEVS